MQALTLDSTGIQELLTADAQEHWTTPLRQAHQSLLDHTCAGHDFLGWLDWPAADHTDLLSQIHAAATNIRTQAQVLVVIGIGGSHLGGQAGLEFIHGTHYNELTRGTQIYFAGHNLSSSTWRDIATALGDRDWAINIISKSGTTLEPALGFGFFQDLLVHKYGSEEANQRIYATTDSRTGLLHDQAVTNGWTRFVVPDDIGGRYSAMSAVGLLPWAVAEIDIAAVLTGAAAARTTLHDDLSWSNPVWQYAAARQILLAQGQNIELLVTYEPRLRLLAKWWQQLFGESEGKTDRVIFPATLDLTQDLHSLGQYIQQGQKFISETTLWLEENPGDEPVQLDEASQAALPFLADQTIDYVGQQAFAGTLAAHREGGVPNLVYRLARADEQTLGYTLYFFELACALSALLLGVNPFDQPGVQAYKNEMMRRLQEN